MCVTPPPLSPVQRLLRASVHPDPPLGAGGEPRTVADGGEPVPGERLLLLLLRHGAVHQGPRPPDGDAQGTVSFSPLSVAAGRPILV